jgi:phage nucleotide-binding protein
MTTTAEVIAGLPIQRPRLREDFINLLVYGEPGIGKTILLGSADDVPEMRPVLIMDVEGGTFSLRDRNPDVDIVRVTTWKEVQDVYDELQAGRTTYRTVVLDSLTEIQKFSMYQIMIDTKIRKPEADPDVPSMHDWSKNIEQIRRFVRAFRDLPMNALFTALAKSDRNPKTGIVTKQPYLSGKLSSEVAGFLDIVVYMYTKNDGENLRRLLLTGATDEYIAKDRSGRLPLVVEEPTMKNLHQIIHGKVTENEPST